MRIPDSIGRSSAAGQRRIAGIAAALLLPLLLGPLAACTATRSAMTISAPRIVETSQAMIMPAPGGPAVISVVEERFSDAVQQKVILATEASNPGQNYFDIRIFGPMERETQGSDGLGYREFTAPMLSREVISAMPGVAMKTSTLFLRNTYGTFGYAFGQTPSGDGCIYGWQQVRSREAERKNFRNAGAIQIRLRLCEAGAGEKELLTAMYGYTVTATIHSEQWNPFGPPRGLDANMAGGPVYPQDSELAAAPKVATVRPPRRRPVVVRTEDPEKALQEAAEKERAAKQVLDVPSPSGNEDGLPASDGAAPSERPDEQIFVPGPDCPAGSPSCN